MPERERPAPGGGGDAQDKEETRSKLFVNSIRTGDEEKGEGGLDKSSWGKVCVDGETMVTVFHKK